jgi:penicillin-binding protein 2
MQKEDRFRVRLLYFMIFLLIITLLSRTFYLDVVKGPYYKELSEYRSLRIIEETPVRGRILDRNGVVLAESIPSYALVIVPEDVHDKTEFDKVASFLNFKKGDIENIVQKANMPSYYNIIIKSNLSRNDIALLDEHAYELPGFNIIVSSKRYYPFGTIGANFLGFVGPVTDSDLKNDSFYSYNDLIGKQGLELQYENYLRGEKGKNEVLVDSVGRVKQVLFTQDAVPGSDIQISVDINVQKNLETIVGDKTGVAIALDPKTGEVIAMVSHPTFDPNLFVKGISQADYEILESKNAFLNRATQATYPTGSTFKPITLMAALESGTITPSTVIYCANSINLGGRIFKDWIYPQAFGQQTASVALSNSSDVFFYTIGIRTGIDAISKFAKLVKLDQETGIDLPYESSGLIPDPTWKQKTTGESWYIGDTANLSIGQGYLLISPLSMASFYASLACKGTEYVPHFLRKVISPSGKVIYTYGKKVRLKYNVREQTWKTVLDGLEGLTNKPDIRIVRVNNAQIFTKTGTAEAGNNEVHHWLISFGEANNPKVVGLLFFENSKFSSSHALAPLMRDLLKNFF